MRSHEFRKLRQLSLQPTLSSKQWRPWVRHQQVMCIDNEGMPYHGNPFTKGRLFVLFEVEMPAPRTLTQQQMQVLSTVLPAGEPCEATDEAEPCSLTPVDVSQFGKSGHGMGGNEAYDSDDEAGGAGGQRVQCAQQ